MTWFIDIRWQRFAMPDIAKRATARTDITEDHEGRCAATEALADIRASRLFTNRVQLLLTQHLLDFAKTTGIVTGFNADPVRFAQSFLRHDLDRDPCRFKFAFLFDPGVSHGISPVVSANASTGLRLPPKVLD